MTADSWVGALFLAEVAPPLRDAFAALAEPDLEALLTAAYGAGRSAWPAVELDAERFIRHVAHVLDEIETSPQQTLAAMRAPDLYLACACMYGDDAAIEILERDYVSTLAAPVRSAGLDAGHAEDILQRVRELVVLGTDGIPLIASYSGRGQLRSWLRAVAIRQAMMHFRGQRETPVGDSALLDMPGISDDPQLAPWKQQYAAAIRAALEHAINELDDRQRTLLRQHHLDGTSILGLAKLHRVHRVTVARWLTEAREALLAGMRNRIIDELEISGSELDSALRMARSQLDLSFHRLLGARRGRKAQ